MQIYIFYKILKFIYKPLYTFKIYILFVTWSYYNLYDYSAADRYSLISPFQLNVSVDDQKSVFTFTCTVFVLN